MVVVDLNNLKNGRKPVKLQKESPAGCLLDDSVVSRFVCLQTDHNNNKNGGL